MKRHLIIFISLVLLCGKGFSQVAIVPFEFGASKHIFIKVGVGSNDSLRFVFDSGCTGANIDSMAAVRAGISLQDLQRVQVGGFGGSQTLFMALHQDLRIGRLNINDIGLVLSDLSGISKAIGTKLDGIVGYEVLMKYVTKLDFEKRQISFYNSIAETDTAGFKGISFGFYKGVQIPRFPISITMNNGETVTGRAMFDTGNGGTLTISAPFAKFHNLAAKAGKAMERKGYGVMPAPELILVIKNMDYSGFSFGKMAVTMTLNEQAEPKDGYLGIVGIDVIRRFNVIMDYGNQKIWLKPNSNYRSSFYFPPGTESW
ncbi:aspartyl protease family protein [Pararcticibacter amylolyticus]|nr:aspartyl protease family protein [Pararcticibacter amylolyticus]